MERQRLLVALAAAILSLAFTEQVTAQAPGGEKPGIRNGRTGQFRAARERWRQMAPEDRQRLRTNAARWLELPPEERRQLRLRDGWRQERLRREAADALQNSGLQLEAEKRSLYEQRYLQERRRIERAIRQEAEEKRRREMAPVVEDLKKEFSQPTGNPSAANTSPSPAK